MKETEEQNQPRKLSLKQTIAVASVVASLGASLGVYVGDALADENPFDRSNPAYSRQFKMDDQTGGAQQNIQSNQFKFTPPSNQFKQQGPIKMNPSQK